MKSLLQPWQLLLLILAGWINHREQEVIEYLRAENRVLREKLGKKRILLNDDPGSNRPRRAVAAGQPSFFTSVCCRSARIRRSYDLIKRERSVRSMRVGPSGSAFRSRSQTTSKLLRSRAVVVSVGGKARGKLVQVCIRETNESEPIEDASLKIQVSSKPGA